MKFLDMAPLASLAVSAGSVVNDVSPIVTIAGIVAATVLRGLQMYLNWRVTRKAV